MNVRRWLGPLPDADAPSETALLVSDIEAGEFAFVRDSNAPDDVLMYLVKFVAVNDTAIEVAAWGTTTKTVHTATYRPVVCLTNHNMAPTTRPGSRRSEPWTWQIPTAGVEKSVLLRQLKLLPSGKLNTASKSRAQALKKLPSGRRLEFCRYQL